MLSLSLGLVGCGAAGNQTGGSNDNNAGTRNLGSNNTTSWQMNTNMNDQRASYPGAYGQNSVYKDGNMGTFSSNQNRKDFGYATYTKKDRVWNKQVHLLLTAMYSLEV